MSPATRHSSNTRTERHCANGADTVTMTPTATATVQTALALTTTVTTVGTHSNDKCKLYLKKAGEKRWPGCNLKDDKAVTQEGSSQLSATARQQTTVNKKQRGGGGGDDGGDGYTKQNGRTMRKRS